VKVVCCPLREEKPDMTPITIDANLSNQLRGLFRPVEFRDSNGEVLGKFIPAVDISEWEPISPDVTEEELDRREKEDQWYTTEEVFAYLKSLENP
jgi:hypothetical protein